MKDNIPTLNGDNVTEGNKEVSVENFDAVSYVRTKIPESSYLRYGFERNWYRNCVAGDTIIPTVDGAYLTISEIAKRFPNGGCYVYSYDENKQKVVTSRVEHAELMGTKKTVKVHLDNNEFFEVTEDHRILTMFRGWRMAKDLIIGESLMPFYFCTAGTGYEQVYQPADCKWEYTHKLSFESNGGIVGIKTHIHHLDGNKNNNVPENLQQIDSREHCRISLKNVPYHRVHGKKATKEWRDACAIRAKAQWKDNHDFMMESIEKRNSNPEYKKRKSEGVKKWWESRKLGVTINHRVTKVEDSRITEVYDLQVAGTHNFAISKGVFVHNCLFYIGKQWIKYDVKQRRWVRPNLPEWMPTPITNRFASTCDAMMSVLDQIRPRILYAPATDNPEDLATSDVCNAVVDVIEEETMWEKVKGVAKLWLTLTGNVFFVSYYDNDPKWGEIFISNNECQQCGMTAQPNEFKQGMCPQCGGQQLREVESGQSYPRGKMTTECVPPFEIYTDLRCTDIENATYIMRAKTLPLETIRQRWPETGKNIKSEGTAGNLGQFFYTSLAYITNTNDTGFGSGTEYGGGMVSDASTVWELWIPQSANFPQGIHAFVGGNIELEKGPLEYHDTDGHGIIPLIHVKFKEAPGRLFAKTPADDIIHKQIQRNKLEAFIQLAVHRTSNPVWLLPQSCGAVDITGEPGQTIKYNDSNAFRSRPEKIPGTEITQAVFRWLEKIDSDFEELCSTYDIVKGSMPQNVPTLGGLELLKERGLSRFGNVIQNWENAQVTLTRHWLWIWREYVTEARTKSIKGKNSQWVVQKFSNANLTGNIDVRAEAGSSSPRSEAYQQYIVGQLLDKGLIDANDITTKMRILQAFHAADFAEDMDIDVRDSIQEEDEFKMKGVVRFRPFIDNNLVHSASHKRFAKTEEFRNMPAEAQTMFFNHLMETDQYVAQQQMAMAMQGQQPNLSPSPQQAVSQSKGPNSPK